jgi:hypothetical protein
MTGTILFLAALTTAQVSEPSGGDLWPTSSCNKQGTAFDVVWQTASSSGNIVYHQRGSAGFVPSDGAATVLSSYGTTGTTLIVPAFAPAIVVDTDDTSTSPNYAAVWCISVPPPANPQYYPLVSVNGHAPFPVGNGITATNAYVAVSRQLQSYEGTTGMAVAVVFGEGPVYAQVFMVTPSTGQPFASSAPIYICSGGTYNGSYGQIALGGVAGDDFGNFVAVYVRQYEQEQSPLTGVYAWGLNYLGVLGGSKTNLLNGLTPSYETRQGYGTTGTYVDAEFQVSGSGSEYTWSRIACYHGSSVTNGGFVAAHGGDGISCQRYTTNWTNTTNTAGSGVTVSPNPQNYYFITQQAGYPQWSLACTRDTPGTYVVSWSTDLPYYGDNFTQNIMYATVTKDANVTWTFTTDYGVYSGTYVPVAFALYPWVAASDLSYGGASLIAWIYASNTESGNTGPGVMDASWFTMP